MKRRFLSPFAVTQVLMAAIIAVALWLAYWPWRWGQIKDDLRRLYPEVKFIDGIKLQQWMASRTDPPLLLDVRSKAEFEFSRLPSARHAALGATPLENGLEGKTSAKVVVYDHFGSSACSFATRLAEQGFKDLQVLEGGIYEWANEDRPLFDTTGQVVRKVRAAVDEYASLLRSSKKAD